MSRRADACGAGDGEPDVAVARHFGVAGVDAHAHLDLDTVRPLVLREGPLRFCSRLHRMPSSSKDDEEGLGLTVDDDAAVLGKRGLQQMAMLGNDRLIRVPQPVLELGRALDVSEEQRDRAVRQSAHARIVMLRGKPGKDADGTQPTRRETRHERTRGHGRTRRPAADRSSGSRRPPISCVHNVGG